MDIRQAIHSDHAKQLDTAGLRREFLIENIFKKDDFTITYSHIDRIMVGGIMPVTKSITLPDSLGQAIGTTYFLERRELGLINIGGSAIIEADGVVFELANQDALYLGKETKTVTLTSKDSLNPAKLYFNSAPAHARYPSRIITAAQAAPVTLGDVKNSNRRTINKYLVPDVLPTCQLVMGLTRLDEGNLWNTMPCHTHDRRMEVYLYFNMDPQTAVFHMMGEATETRHILVHNEQAVISPSWSLHSGVGTQAYTFIWGMVGENQTFDDMDHIAIADLR